MQQQHRAAAACWLARRPAAAASLRMRHRAISTNIGHQLVQLFVHTDKSPIAACDLAVRLRLLSRQGRQHSTLSTGHILLNDFCDKHHLQ